MRRYESKEVNQLVEVDIVCDACGESCRKEMDFEYASLWAEWGYGSSLDGIVWDYDFCESCSVKMLNFILGKAYD